MSTKVDDADDILSGIEKYLEEDRRKERPDYNITVYCDKHPEVKMCHAVSWSSHENPDDWADVNPNLLWSCPKPECDRFYEPTMFGYYNERGHRLDDKEPQPRGDEYQIRDVLKLPHFNSPASQRPSSSMWKYTTPA